MFLDYFALCMLVFVSLTIFYGIIAIHDIPYDIAKKRNHPHQDAIHAAGWVSLFTLHALWPFLWIWATLWRDDRGWGFNKLESEHQDNLHKISLLAEKVSQLETQIQQLGQPKTVAVTPPVAAPKNDTAE
ncbi:DUF3302 domain-containing protein [Shewanella sp.]|uniref:DUF3302 domain-containing protein n=1 Tax=Shewanella sp. TaxID=50422 RepID=UPI003A97421A